jgi:hypothetical protein
LFILTPIFWDDAVGYKRFIKQFRSCLVVGT